MIKRVWGNSLQEMVEQPQVHHGDLIQNHRALGIICIAAKVQTAAAIAIITKLRRRWIVWAFLPVASASRQPGR